MKLRQGRQEISVDNDVVYHNAVELATDEHFKSLWPHIKSRRRGHGRGCFGMRSTASSKALLLQAFVVWTTLVIPPILVTLYLYQTSNPTSSACESETPDQVSSWKFEHLPVCQNFESGKLPACVPQVCQPGILGHQEALSLAQCFGVDLASSSDGRAYLCSIWHSTRILAEFLNKICSSNGTESPRDLGPSPEEEIEIQSAPSHALMNTTLEVSCGERMVDYQYLIAGSHFWIKGIALTILGSFGLIGNVITIFVLAKLPTSKNFNKLLITLATCDSLLIVYFLMEKSIVETFSLQEPLWYRAAYPHILHPLRGIIETATVYMVVVISAERFRAICHPLSQSQPPVRYILFVLGLSGTLEIPRWFEFQLIHVNGTLHYWTTDLMENPQYIRFSSYWDELIATGFVPLLALVYFNFRIYLKIRASSRFRNRHIRSGPSIRMEMKRVPQLAESSPCNDTSEIHPFETSRITRGTLQDEGHPLRHNSTRRSFGSHTRSSSRQKCLTSMSFRAKQARSEEEEDDGSEITPIKEAEAPESSWLTSMGEKIAQRPLGGVKSREAVVAAQPRLNLKLAKGSNHVFNSSEREQPPSRSSTITVKRGSSNLTAHVPFRKKREKSTIILVMIVLIFVACHAYRLALKVYEFANPANQTLEHYTFCEQRGRYSVPVSFFMLLTTNDIFLVFNSSVNFVIYCLVVKEFRQCVARYFFCTF